MTNWIWCTEDRWTSLAQEIRRRLQGEDLIIAFENLLADQPQEEFQIPSVGCGISGNKL